MIRKLFLVSLILTTVFILSCATKSATVHPPTGTPLPVDRENVAYQSLTKGVDFAAQGKFNEAKEEFEKALKADPFYLPAKESLKVIKDVIGEKTKSEAAIHLFKGAAFVLKGQRDAKTYYNRGLAYGNKSQYNKAISDYNKAIEINPKFAGAYNNRGLAYKNKGQYNKAISDYNKAIEINPKFAGAFNNRGVAYYIKREYDKAWEDVHKAQSLGYQVHPGFLKALREVSGRQK